MSTKKERMYQEIREHGENLIRVFNLPSDTDPIKLCKKLHTIEVKLSRITEDECNGVGDEIENHGKISKLLTSAKKVLFPTHAAMLENEELYHAVFVNGDPRGYALKIKSEYVSKHDVFIYRDFGGYGILSPEFTGNR